MEFLKAKARIFDGLGAAAILITLTLGILAYTQMRTIKATAIRITGDTMPSIYLSGQLQSVTLLRYSLLMDYVDGGGDRGEAALLRQIDSANTQIDGLIKRYESLIDVPEDIQLFAALKSARTPYDACYAQVLELRRKGQRDQAHELIASQLIPLRNAFLKAAEAEVIWNKADADDSAHAITTALSSSSTGFLIGLALISCIFWSAQSIRRQLHIETALRESEDRFHEVFAHAPVGMCVVALGGRLTQVNAAFCKLLGYSEAELLDKSMPALCHPDDLAAMAAVMRQLWERPPVRTDPSRAEMDQRYLHKNGSLLWCRQRISILRAAGGLPRCSVIQVEDVTESRRAGEALRESEERFRTMADACPSMMWVSNAAGECDFVNRACREFSGATTEEMQANGWRLPIHPDDAMEYEAALGQSVKSRSSFSAECRIRRADGEWRLVGSRAEPRFDPTGEYMGHIGLRADITERRREETAAREAHEFTLTTLEALQKSEAKFRQLADNIAEVFWMMNAAGTEMLYVSPAYEPIWGRTCKSLYERPMDWLEAIHPSDRDSAHETFLRQLQGENIDSEYRIHTPDGQEKWICDRAFPIRDQAGALVRVAGIAEDATERKRREEELIRARMDAEAANQKLSAQHALLDRERTVLRTFIDNVPDFMYVKDLESRFVIANSQVANSAGVARPEDLAGKTDFDLYAPETARSFYEDEQRVIRSGQPMIDREETIEGRAGAETRAILTTKVPLFDREGRVTGIAGIGRNITERKKAEDALREINRQLREATARANELALEADAANRAKSRFLANMSHEIRTPMNGVIGMNQLLLETGLTAEQRRFVEVAQASGQALLTLIDDILDLSKIEAGKITLEIRSFDLRRTVEDVAQLLRVGAETKGLELVARVSPKIPGAVRGDAHRLRQVLMNLAGNAVKFTQRGAVTLIAELESLGGPRATVRFSVTDTGIGIGPGQIKSLFTPFVQADASTTRKYGGTGLGLAISKQLAEMMGGRIGVDSQEGQGSTFWFTASFELTAPAEPVSPQEERERAVVALPAAAPKREQDRVQGARILVAEDNATNREVILAQLRKLGYEGEAFPDGAEAVEAIEKRRYALVLMDCQMPVMDGYEATRRIRASNHPRLPIVALTASAMSSDRERCLREGMDDYLAKPVDLTRLAQMLSKWVSVPDSERAGAAPSASAAEPSLLTFDADALMSRLMDDRPLALAVLKGFFQDVPTQFLRLRERLDQEDKAGVRLQAHALKGASATVGALSLASHVQEMETAAAGGDLARCRALLPRLMRECQRFREAVERGGWISGAGEGSGVEEASGVQT
jgi:PAS domain S-box-containing protein